MNVKAIMQYLGKCRREISELANVRGEKSVSYWFDYLWCAVRHGCLIRQYVCNHSIFRLDTHVP